MQAAGTAPAPTCPSDFASDAPHAYSSSKDTSGSVRYRGAAVITCLLMLSASIYLVSSYTIGSSSALTWNGYGFSELLINYDGGFVRRGLLGAIIQHAAALSGHSTLSVVNRLVFTDFFLLALLLPALTLLSRRRSGLMALLVLMMPGGVVSIALSTEYFYRKEILFYIALCIPACLICLLHRTQSNILRRGTSLAAVAFIILFGLVLPLVHESFLFISAPANALLLFAACRALQSNGNPVARRRFARGMALSYLALQAVIFLVLSSFRGSSEVAQIMWDKLPLADRVLLGNTGPHSNAFEAVGWGVSHAFWMAVQVILSGFAWYWLVPLIAGFLYCIALTLLNSRTPDTAEAIRRSHTLAWIVCYLALTLSASPIFLLGWDWGRWILAINISFVILWLSIEPHELPAIAMMIPLPRSAHAALQRVSTPLHGVADVFSRRGLRYRRLLPAAMLLFSITFRMPECCLGSSSTVDRAKLAIKRLAARHNASSAAASGNTQYR